MKNLTRYPEGSIREIFWISLPLMLAALSASLMFFCDRFILARFSTDAMNAAATAGMPCYIFHYGAIGVAAIAEVFVGQYNGAKQRHKMGEPVWQMLWFSAFSCIIFLPLAEYAGIWLIPEQYQQLGMPYFKWFMASGPIFAGTIALSAFFIGQGKVLIITITVAVGNCANIFLDILLVFGYSNLISPMGVEGAAIATFISQVIQTLILLSIFLNKNYRLTSGTTNWKFQPILFKKCLKIGAPSSLNHILEIAAWTVLLYLMATVSKDHVTLFTIGQTFFVLFVFITEGSQKGITALTANFIGANKWPKIEKSLTAAIKLQLIFAVILYIPLVMLPELIIDYFLVNIKQQTSAFNLYQSAIDTCFWVWVYFILDGIIWIIAGILTAAEDTMFIMLANSCNAFLFSLLPTYLFVAKNNGSPTLCWKFACLYALANVIIFYMRYKSKRWKKNYLENYLELEGVAK